MQLEKERSVRIDIVGGTLDISPLNLLIPGAITLNLATSIKAKVNISDTDFEGVVLKSTDYELQRKFKFDEFNDENFSTDHFGKLDFLARVIHLFKPTKGLEVEISSGSPPGGGLGGSSTIGITLYLALCDFFEKEEDPELALKKVKDVEAIILKSGPTGYQDYYPALYGGILALHPKPGSIEVEQLYSPELKKYVEEHFTLIYSGETRLSGLNNWEIYKAYFNKDKKTIKSLEDIADLSRQTYDAIKRKNFSLLTNLISQEGEERKRMHPDIITESMDNFYQSLKKEVPHIGMKACGAGGGGCYLLLHQPSDMQMVEDFVKGKDSQIQKLKFTVEKPINL